MNISSRNINFSDLIGITPIDNFKMIIDNKIWQYHSLDKSFTVFMIEFDIVNESDSSSIDTFIDLIANTIYSNIKRGYDLYAVDSGGRFLIFFPDRSTGSAESIVNTILDDVKGQIGKYIKIILSTAEYPRDGSTYKDLVGSASKFLDRIKEKTVKSQHGKYSRTILTESKKDTVKQLGDLIQQISDYDKFLSEHSALVTAGAIIFAKELDLSWPEIERISVAALLHDIGYTVFPRSIFRVQGKLAPDEWKLVKLHPLIACEQILRPLEVFDDYVPIIMNHHEFIDGSGYPKGKKGDQIPLGAQIISIIDSFQAMRTDRLYRKAVDVEDIIDIYIRSAGIKWDKELITTFTAIIADQSIREKLASGDSMNFEVDPFW